MKCPKYGEEMEEGYSFLESIYTLGLYWSKEEPSKFWALGSQLPREYLTMLERSGAHSDEKNRLS